MTFLNKSSLEVLGEVMAARVWTETSCQKKLETKARRKTQDTLLEKFGEIYSEKFCNNRKATGLGGIQGPGPGPHRGLGWGRGRGPPLPPGVRLVLRLVSEFS